MPSRFSSCTPVSVFVANLTIPERVDKGPYQKPSTVSNVLPFLLDSPASPVFSLSFEEDRTGLVLAGLIFF